MVKTLHHHPEEKTTLDTPTYYLDNTSEDSFPLEVDKVKWVMLKPHKMMDNTNTLARECTEEAQYPEHAVQICKDDRLVFHPMCSVCCL